MASTTKTTIAGFNFSMQWFITAVTILVGGVFGYVMYNAIMATASELIQRLLVISPLILVMVVHWLSSGDKLSIPFPGSETSSIHRAGGSAWGVAFVLLLLIVLISFQHSLNGLIF